MVLYDIIEWYHMLWSLGVFANWGTSQTGYNDTLSRIRIVRMNHFIGISKCYGGKTMIFVVIFEVDTTFGHVLSNTCWFHCVTILFRRQVGRVWKWGIPITYDKFYLWKPSYILRLNIGGSPGVLVNVPSKPDGYDHLGTFGGWGELLQQFLGGLKP